MRGLSVGARKAKRTAAPRNPGGGEARGRWRPEVVRLLAGRTGKLRRAVRASDGPGVNPDGGRALARRVGRIRRALYDLYGDLEYFESSPLEHRERLRQVLDWPDVGHITSLLRSLSEEKRFAEWLGLNTFAREKSA